MYDASLWPKQSHAVFSMEKCKTVAVLSLFTYVQDHTFTWDYSSVAGCNEN